MDDFLPDPIIYHETYFNKEGKQCENNDNCFAKTLSKNIDGKISMTYSILCKMNLMMDPWGDDCSQRKSIENTFKRVNEDCFRLYLRYLKTRERRFLTLSQRKQNG
jgi:hypothetical protein